MVVYLSGKRGGADVLEEKTTFITACIAITIATVTRSLGAPDVEGKKQCSENNAFLLNPF